VANTGVVNPFFGNGYLSFTLKLCKETVLDHFPHCWHYWLCSWESVAKYCKY